jgi:anti-sigma factor RsiW
MQTGGAKAVKISCDEVWRQISNYLEGEISVGLRARMDEHLKDCKRCAAVVVDSQCSAVGRRRLGL